MLDNLKVKHLNHRTKPEKLITDSRGLIYEVSHGETVKHIAIITINGGCVRGGHYHKNATEIFFIVKGHVWAYFLDIKTKELLTLMLKEGEKISVHPGIVHTFHGLSEESILLEYSPQVLDINDKYTL